MIGLSPGIDALAPIVFQNEVTIPGNSTICVNRFNGQMMGQNVSVVSSGIGPLNAALCTSEVLECAANIKDFIYSGTSGWSTAVSSAKIICKSRQRQATARF